MIVASAARADGQRAQEGKGCFVELCESRERFRQSLARTLSRFQRVYACVSRGSRNAEIEAILVVEL